MADQDKAQTETPETSPSPPPAAPRTLLDLDTHVRRDVVRIDGEPYELRNPAEFTILEDHRMGVKGQRIVALYSKGDDLVEDEVAEIVQIAEGILASILMAPDEVRGRLADVHKLQVIQAFTASRDVPAVEGITAEPAEEGSR